MEAGFSHNTYHALFTYLGLWTQLSMENDTSPLYNSCDFSVSHRDTFDLQQTFQTVFTRVINVSSTSVVTGMLRISIPVENSRKTEKLLKHIARQKLSSGDEVSLERVGIRVHTWNQLAISGGLTIRELSLSSPKVVGTFLHAFERSVEDEVYSEMFGALQTLRITVPASSLPELPPVNFESPKPLSHLQKLSNILSIRRGLGLGPKILYIGQVAINVDHPVGILSALGLL